MPADPPAAGQPFGRLRVNSDRPALQIGKSREVIRISDYEHLRTGITSAGIAPLTTHKSG